MTDWRMTELGEIIYTLKGYAFKSSKYVTKGVPVVRVSDFTTNSIVSDDIKYYSEDEAYNYEKYRLSCNDVLIQTVGSWQSNPASIVGKVVRVPFDFEGALLNQNIVKVFPQNNLTLNNRFLFYRLKNDDFKQHNLGNAVGAANQASITLDTIKSFKFLLPDIASQRRIASILSAYDDLIENNQKQIKLLEEAAMRLYKEWFVKLRFPGHESLKVVAGVPEGWNNAIFSDLCDLIKESCNQKNIKIGTPHIGLEHLPRKGICLTEWGESSEINSNKFRYKRGDVLFGKIRPYFHKVGFTINDGVCSTDAMVFRAKENMFALLLTTVFSDAFVKHSYTTCREGAKMPRADWNEMSKYTVLIPENNVLQMYNESINSISSMIESLCKQNLLLKEARNKLLPKLMSGEIEV